jgi:hypothetical protein
LESNLSNIGRSHLIERERDIERRGGREGGERWYVVHIYNPSFSEGGNRRIPIQGQPGKGPVSKTSWTWWHMPAIPATLEAEVEGSQSKGSQDKNWRPYLPLKTTKSKVAWLKCHRQA